VYIDEMGETELSGEVIWTTKGFGSERDEVIDMLRFPAPKRGWSNGSFKTLL
jgi:hypothetical protein